MIKTYESKDRIIFKGLQYTGKNIEEFYKQVNYPNNEMGIRVQTGMTSPVTEDASGLYLYFNGAYLELKKGDHFLFSRDTLLYGVFNNGELKREFEQVK